MFVRGKNSPSCQISDFPRLVEADVDRRAAQYRFGSSMVRIVILVRCPQTLLSGPWPNSRSYRSRLDANDRSFAMSAISSPGDAAPAQGRFGSSAADRGALITTTLHSEAANSGAKRETGRCTFESCRSPTGRKGPRAAVRRLRQLNLCDRRSAEKADIVPGSPNGPWNN
jgi:hypothetical protein